MGYGNSRSRNSLNKHKKNLSLIKVSRAENLALQEKYFNWFILFAGIYFSSSIINIIPLWMGMEKTLCFTQII